MTRDILELRAEVEPGDSGGPFVLEDGTVAGVVFAESRTDESVGLRPGRGRRRPARGAGDRPHEPRGRGLLSPLSTTGPVAFAP